MEELPKKEFVTNSESQLIKNLDVPYQPGVTWTEEDWSKMTTWLKSVLKENEVYITFTKIDGTEREMLCTLKTDNIPIAESKVTKKERKVSSDTISVFDLEKKDWRSFRIKSIKRIRFEL